MGDVKNGYQATPNATLEQQGDTCPTCGSECNERDELTKAEREIERLRAEVEALRGITPELPPRPPDGGGLPRYGLRHNGQSMPMSVPMADGYWTPHHLAIAEVEALRADAERWEHARSIACFTEDRDMGPGGWWTVAVHVKRRPAANTIDAAVDAARAAQGGKT